MTAVEVMEALAECRTKESTGTQGALIHISYSPFNEGTELSREQSQPARDMDLPLNHYTGRLDRVFTNAHGQLCFTVLVELERSDSDGHPVYRTFNAVEGTVNHIHVVEA